MGYIDVIKEQRNNIIISCNEINTKIEKYNSDNSKKEIGKLKQEEVCWNREDELRAGIFSEIFSLVGLGLSTYLYISEREKSDFVLLILICTFTYVTLMNIDSLKEYNEACKIYDDIEYQMIENDENRDKLLKRLTELRGYLDKYNLAMNCINSLSDEEKELYLKLKI